MEGSSDTTEEEKKAQRWRLRFLVVIMTIDLVVLWLGIRFSDYIAYAVALIGILTFVAFLYYGYALHKKPEPGDMRRAIAGTFSILYIVILVVVGFTYIGFGNRFQWIVQNFTLLYSVVIGFYFGASVYEKVKTKAGKETGQSSES